MNAAAPPPNVRAPTLNATPLRLGQNFTGAIVAGLGAALLGAIAWAIVTVLSKTELGLMAVAVGFMVGRAIRAVGRGIDPQFGYLGAACALFGCALGNVLSDIGFYADTMKLDYGAALGQMNLDLLGRLIPAFFRPMDLLFYAIAIYEGYKFSFKYRLLKRPPAAPAT